MRQAFRPITSVKRQAFALALSLTLLAPIAMAQAPAQLETTMKSMLAAIQSKSLADFVAGGDASFRSGMTQPMLDGVSAQLGPRLSQGYTASFLGSLNQEGFTVYLWKVVFKDGKDDRLVTMAVRDGKVAGFFLR
jgi:hypothetical protein